MPSMTTIAHTGRPDWVTSLRQPFVVSGSSRSSPWLDRRDIPHLRQSAHSEDVVEALVRVAEFLDFARANEPSPARPYWPPVHLGESDNFDLDPLERDWTGGQMEGQHLRVIDWHDLFECLVADAENPDGMRSRRHLVQAVVAQTVRNRSQTETWQADDRAFHGDVGRYVDDFTLKDYRVGATHLLCREHCREPCRSRKRVPTSASTEEASRARRAGNGRARVIIAA